MKTQLLFIAILFFLCCFTLQGQNSAVDIIYGKQFFKFSKDFATPNKKQLGNRIGLNYNFKVGAANWIQTGIHYYELKEKSAQLGPFITPPSVTPTTLPDTVSSLQYFFTAQYFEIPVNFRTEFGDKKLKPFIEGGVSVNLLFDQKRKRILDGVSSTDSYREFYERKASFIISVSTGLSYTLSKRFIVLVQPFYKINLTDENAFDDRSFVINYGVQTGLRMLL